MEDYGPCMHLTFSFFSFFPATELDDRGKKLGPETVDRFKDRVGANVIAYPLD